MSGRVCAKSPFKKKKTPGIEYILSQKRYIPGKKRYIPGRK